MFDAIARCRICDNPRLEPILDLGMQALTGVFPRTAEEAVTSGPLQLVKCHGARGGEQCGLVQLAHNYSPSEMYGDNYGYRSGLNRSMVEHLRKKPPALQRLAPLAVGDLVLDIGSNDGTLLSFYPEQGPELVGIDPTSRKFAQYYKPHIRAIPDFFTKETFCRAFPGRRAKIITSIAMFYDLPRPQDFVNDIAAVLDPQGVWHFEQSYLPGMLQALAYDTVCHEHYEFYALRQVVYLLARAGLKILDVELNDSNGGSFAVTAAHAGSPLPANTAVIEEMLAAEDRMGLSELDVYYQFRQRVAEHREQLRRVLADLADQGRRVIGYGASTKGNVLLQYCGLTERELSCIAEVNAEKFGRWTPGSRIPIVSEAAARELHADYYLVLPWHFEQNIVAREQAYLAGGGRLLFPLPAIHLVGGGPRGAGQTTS